MSSKWGIQNGNRKKEQGKQNRKNYEKAKFSEISKVTDNASCNWQCYKIYF